MRAIGFRALLLPLLIGLTVSGCAAAALAGAGAATGIYLTTRGAKGVVEGTVTDVDRRVGLVLAEQNISITSREVSKDGRKIEIDGKTSEGNNVHVEIERKSANTAEVEVAIRKDPVVWDQDRAREILRRIVTIE